MSHREKEYSVVTRICGESQEWKNKLIAEIQRRNGRRKDPFKNNNVTPKIPEKDITAQIMIRKIIEGGNNQS